MSDNLAGFAYLSLANDPTIMMFMREMQAQLPDDRIEWQPAPTLHITLAFAPAVDDAMLAEVARSIHMPDWVGVDFDGIGIFENGEERAMHLRCLPNDALITLQREVFEAFVTRGIEVSPYSIPGDWQPHVTLAYLPAGITPEFPDWGAGVGSNKVIVGRGDYEPFAEITAVEIKGKSTIASAQQDGLRLMLIISSNAYKDREEEIVSRKALEQYVAESWDESTKEFIGDNPYLVWHGGDPIGDIIYADTEGPFLIEVARERPNTVVNLAKEGEEPLHAEIKAVWDMLEREPNLAASQQFAYITSDREDGVYEYIKKMETSALPRWAAANYFTEAQVIRS